MPFMEYDHFDESGVPMPRRRSRSARAFAWLMRVARRLLTRRRRD